jgi:hypothetical protein
VHSAAAAFTSHGNYAEPKPFLEPNRHTLSFLHPILLCRSHTEHRWRCSYSANVSYYKLQRKRERKKRERKLKLSGTCKLNAMKEQRTLNCLLGLCTTQKKKLLSLLTLPPSPNFFLFFEFLNFKVPTKSKMSVIFGIISQTNIQLASLVPIKHFEIFPSLFGATLFGTNFLHKCQKNKILKKWLHYYGFGFLGGKRLQNFHPKKEITFQLGF